MIRGLALAVMLLLAGCSDAPVDWRYDYPTGSYGFSQPQAFIYRSGYSIVADTNNNRVLIWNGLPNGRHPDAVLGQTNDFSISPGFEGTTASTLNHPTAVAYDGTYLAVADSGNNRVLVWNPLPTSGYGAPAQWVLGQPTFNQNGVSSPSANDFNNPTGVALGGNVPPIALAIADRGNNRVLYWSDISLAVNQTQAPWTVGQIDSNTVAGSSCTANGLASPAGVTINPSDGSLLVADTGNNRVTYYSPPPSANAPIATNVWGQSGFATCLINDPSLADLFKMNAPTAVYATASRMLVADSGNLRVLAWNAPGYAAPGPASVQFGQSSDSAFGPATSYFGNSGPGGVDSDDTTLLTVDSWNNRILYWGPVFPAGPPTPSPSSIWNGYF